MELKCRWKNSLKNYISKFKNLQISNILGHKSCKQRSKGVCLKWTEDNLNSAYTIQLTDFAKKKKQ